MARGPQFEENAMAEIREELMAARKLINILARACRQTKAYLDGISVMDEKKVKRALQEAIKASDNFLRP